MALSLIRSLSLARSLSLSPCGDAADALVLRRILGVDVLTPRLWHATYNLPARLFDDRSRRNQPVNVFIETRPCRRRWPAVARKYGAG